MKKKKYPRGPQINVRLSPVYHMKLKYAALAQETSVSKFVKNLLLPVLDGKK